MYIYNIYSLIVIIYIGDRLMVEYWWTISLINYCFHQTSGDFRYVWLPEGTLWLFNIAMENVPFVDGLPIKNGDFPWLY